MTALDLGGCSGGATAASPSNQTDVARCWRHSTPAGSPANASHSSDDSSLLAAFAVPPTHMQLVIEGSTGASASSGPGGLSVPVGLHGAQFSAQLYNGLSFPDTSGRDVLQCRNDTCVVRAVPQLLAAAPTAAKYNMLNDALRVTEWMASSASVRATLSKCRHVYLSVALASAHIHFHIHTYIPLLGSYPLYHQAPCIPFPLLPPPLYDEMQTRRASPSLCRSNQRHLLGFSHHP